MGQIFGVLLFGYLIYVLVRMVIRVMSGSFEAVVTYFAPNSRLAKRYKTVPLTLLVEDVEKDFDGETYRVFSCDVKGVLVSHEPDAPCRFFLHMFDMEGDTENPVICGLNQFQENESVIFEYMTQDFSFEHRRHVLTEPSHLTDIPVDFLQCAESGKRRLKFVLHMVCGQYSPEYQYGAPVSWPRASVTAIAETEIEYEYLGTGYREEGDLAERIDELSIRLAMSMSAADSELDPAEGKIVREWLVKHFSQHGGDSAGIDQQKARYNRFVVDAYTDALGGKLDVQADCQELLQIAAVPARYDALELCLQVASADGVAAKEELAVLEVMSQALELDLERVRAMRDRELPVDIHTGHLDYSGLLGITDDMTPDQIRKHLNSEYRKWNARVTNADEAIRKQADEMLTLIAQCREELLS